MDANSASNRHGRSWCENPFAGDRSDRFPLIEASPGTCGQAVYSSVFQVFERARSLDGTLMRVGLSSPNEPVSDWKT